MASSARIDELRKKFDENPRRYFAPLANEYRKAGDLSQAIFICQEHLPQQPGHMSGHIVYGQALYEMGRPEEAQVVFETALSLDPENLIALRHLGDIARQANDFAAARSWYQRVLEADPRNEEIAQIMLSLLSAPEPSAESAPAAPPVSSTAPTPLYTPAVPPAPIVDAPETPARAGDDDEPLFVEKSAEAGFGTPTPKSTSAADVRVTGSEDGPDAVAHEATGHPDAPPVAADGNEFLDLDDLTFGGITLGNQGNASHAHDVSVDHSSPPSADDDQATVAGFETFEGGSSWTRSPEPEPERSTPPLQMHDADVVRQPAKSGDAGSGRDLSFDRAQADADVAFEADPFAIAAESAPSTGAGVNRPAEPPQSDARAAMGVFDEFPQSAADEVSSAAGRSESVVEPVDLASAIEFLPANHDAPLGVGDEQSASKGDAVIGSGFDADGAAAKQQSVDAPNLTEGSSEHGLPDVEPAIANANEGEAPSVHAFEDPELGHAAANDESTAPVPSENAEHGEAVGAHPQTEQLQTPDATLDHTMPANDRSENQQVETESVVPHEPAAEMTWSDSSVDEFSSGFTETAEFAGFGDGEQFVGVGSVDAGESARAGNNGQNGIAEHVAAEAPTDEEAATAAPVEAFVTETMAELYLQQGHLDSALGIYHRLVEQRPGDVALHDRMRAVEDRVHGTPAEAVADPSTAGAVYGGPTIRDFLRGLASMRPGTGAQPTAGPANGETDVPDSSDGGEASPVSTGLSNESNDFGDGFSESFSESSSDSDDAPSSAAQPEVSPGETTSESTRFSGETITTSLSELFGREDAAQTQMDPTPDDAAAEQALKSEIEGASPQSKPPVNAESAPAADEAPAAPLHGLPAHRATSELSLDHVFNRATPARADTDAFSLDRFFSNDATAADAKPPADGRVPPPGSDDIAQFNAWLNGLKKT